MAHTERQEENSGSTESWKPREQTGSRRRNEQSTALTATSRGGTRTEFRLVESQFSIGKELTKGNSGGVVRVRV